MNSTDRWPKGLLQATSEVFEPAALHFSSPVPEPESAQYGAYAFAVGGRAAQFRMAKTTPTKAGQFVTLWQRSTEGPIRPFDTSDGVELFIVHVTNGEQRGQFVFPSDILARRGVLSVAGKGGKRAIRVYAPWVATTSAQAVKSQEWQVEYFLEMGPTSDLARIRALYGV
ncbi:MepB family protein [Arthrobacter sp. GMC3]|uniref:MepB family protein n=1 Tax=Arthrobacter sp. GMC3 TaxID=2058894 RepID=UPI000CE37FF8|nr:MepB family protein [Arthrobacter sp. GMC3]